MLKYDATRIGAYAGWRKYAGSPVLSKAFGETFDATVIKLEDKYLMYFGQRNLNTISCSTSKDGIFWSKPVVVLPPDDRQDCVLRQIVVIKDGKYHMWYNGQKVSNGVIDGASDISYAMSEDGIHWVKREEPVMVATEPWEKNSIMCPHVMWDEEMQLFRLWYSAGGIVEPVAIGYATSKDGISWDKYPGNPIFTSNYDNLWERQRVGACTIVKENDWHYMFYIGYENIYKATISFARSRDGITNWERHKDNPIITCGPAGSWDCEDVYKPFPIHEEGKWLLWYNGGRAGIERVGLAMHMGDDLGF